MSSTYSGIPVTPTEVARWEGLGFRDSCYLTYSGTSGTQSGTFGTTLVAPGIWKITQTGTMYYADPADGDIIIVLPDASTANADETFVVAKPSLSRNTRNVSLSTVGGQSIGPNPTYIFDSPGDNVALIATKYGSGGAVSYKWRQVWHNVGAAGIIEVNRLTGFITIKQAVASITDASLTKPYEVIVNPGVYIEDNPITIPPYVVLRGSARDSVYIEPINANQDLIRLNNGTGLKELTFRNASGAAIDISTPTTDCFIIMQDLNFVDCDTWIQSINPTHHVTIDSHTIDGTGTCDIAVNLVATSGLSQPIDGIIHNIEYYPIAGLSANTIIKAQGELLDMTFNSLDVEGGEGTVICGMRIYDGPRIFSNESSFVNVNIAMSGDYLGAAPFLQMTNFSTYNCTREFNFEHPSMTGYINGYYNSNHTVSSNYFNEFRQSSDAEGGVHITGDIYQKPDQITDDINVTYLLRNETNLGLISGGGISNKNGLSADIGAGWGFILDATGGIHYEQWDTTTVEVPSASNSYIVYKHGTGFNTQSNIPDYSTSILLGEVIAVGGSIDHIIDSPIVMTHQPNAIEATLRDGFGPIYRSGSNIYTSTNLTLSASQGVYYYGSDKVTLAGGSPIEWEGYYKTVTGDWTEVEDVTSLDTAFYNPSTGNLSAVDTGNFIKHTFYVVGRGDEEQYLFLYGQTQQSTLEQALTAAAPTPPNFFTNTFVPLANIITEEGSTTVNIIDIRPRFGVASIVSTGGGGTANHGSLLGLDNDDHTQYLLVDGTRAMGGSLNMGGNDIISIGNVDGVDISAHAVRHLPGSGTDELAVATPVSINQTNNIGLQPSFSRSDHIHAHGSQSTSSNHAVVTTTTHEFMASSDKVNLTTIQSTSATWDLGAHYTNILLGTGLINGGKITVNANNTLFDIASGSGIVVDNTTVPGTPSQTLVTWTNMISTVPTYLATDTRSTIIIDSGGNIIQQVSPPSIDQARDYIILGRILHDNKTTLNGAVSIPRVIYNTALDADDMGLSLGSFNITGNVFSAHGANLKLNKSEGTSYRIGSNYNNNPKNPNITTDTAIVSGSFKYRYQVGDGSFQYSAATTDVDPNTFDVGTGTLSAVPTDYYTIQRIYMYPRTSNIYLTPGQAVYSSFTNAKLGISTESPIIDPLFIDATLRAFLIVKQGTVNLQGLDNTFITAGKFGEPMAAGSTGGDVTGPAVSLNNSIARFDGTTGKIIKDNTTTYIDDNGNMTISSLSGLDNEFVLSNTSGMLLSSGYTLIDAAKWDATYTLSSNTSANWNNAFTYASTSSATNNIVNSVVTTTSANWNSVYTSVAPVSANWNSNYTTVNANSANWDTAYTASSAVYRQVTNASYAATTPIADITNVTTTAQTDGVYLISFTCTAVGSANPTTGYIILNINGGDVAITQRDYSRGNSVVTGSLSVTYIATLTAGQIVKVRALESAGTLVLTNNILTLVRL